MFAVHNSLTGKVEEFRPINKGEALMYHCGPTVYDYVHIGNLRSFVLADLLRRTLELMDYEVKQVMNITDIGHLSGDGDDGEDKMTKALKREGKPLTMEAMQSLADHYAEEFKKDIGKMNILLPHLMPKASEHIAEDIELIQKLDEKGFVYKTSDGLYFDTSKDPHYGKLGGIGGGESRIGENREKKNPKDFSLWKFNDSLGYASPFGHGFPGWHIECSAMSQKYLGKTFDFHTGGIDLRPVHHNNEIAQSENACGCDFARYWLHNEFVNVDSGKMAKSEGNVIKIREIEEKGFSPLAYRYFLLLSHYRTPTTFSWEALAQANVPYRHIKDLYSSFPDGGKIIESYRKEFLDAIGNDLNTAQALAVVWNLLRTKNESDANKKATLAEFDKVLGLDLKNNEFEIAEDDIPAEVRFLIHDREDAREAKDFKKSDQLRDEILKKGFVVEDTDSGPRLSKA